jgi:hypothetical protein
MKIGHIREQVQHLFAKAVEDELASIPLQYADQRLDNGH